MRVGWLDICTYGVLLGGKGGRGGTCKGRGVRIGGGEGENVLVTWASDMTSTLRGSPYTEFHRLSRCIRGVIGNARSGVKKTIMGHIHYY